MTDRLAEIRARLEVAQDYRVEWPDHEPGTLAEFIAHAPTDIAWLLAEVEHARAMARAWKNIAYYREAEAWGAEGHPPPKHYPDEALAHGYKKDLRQIERRARILNRPPMPWVEKHRRFLVAELERLRGDEPVAQGVTKLECSDG